MLRSAAGTHAPRTPCAWTSWAAPWAASLEPAPGAFVGTFAIPNFCSTDPLSTSRRPKVLIYRPVDETGRSHRQLTEAGCEVVAGELDAEPAALLRAAPDADALLGSTFRGGVLGREVLGAFPALRVISKYTIGTDDVDVDAATALGILVTHCPTEANWGGVAEGTIALMLALLKKLAARDRQVKTGGWRDKGLEGRYVGRRADGYPGLTIGIVGLGRIGTRVAELLAPWRLRLLAADPYVEAAKFLACGAECVDLAVLLRESDVVTLHCSLTAETRGLIGARELAAMRPGALLINTARGPMVDVEALCDALEEGRLGGAALDVLPVEPPPKDSRLLRFGDTLVLSPHMIAANQGGTLQAAIPWATEAVLAALRSLIPEYVCNPEAIARWRVRFGERPLLGKE
ncbi:MAG TPA: NAD(P)-dependent oxidoreductase [Gammaproteobacteria bacterium]|nr:NAD(P)-dependent oxidoreductase [Gammaproteobacteria bacterium]